MRSTSALRVTPGVDIPVGAPSRLRHPAPVLVLAGPGQGCTAGLEEVARAWLDSDNGATTVVRLGVPPEAPGAAMCSVDGSLPEVLPWPAALAEATPIESGNPPVILLDDTELISAGDFEDVFRWLAGQWRRGARVAIAVHPLLGVEGAEDRWSRFPEVARRTVHRASDETIRHIFAGADVRLTPDAADIAVRLSAGNPKLARELVARLQDRAPDPAPGAPPGPADADCAVVREAHLGAIRTFARQVVARVPSAGASCLFAALLLQAAGALDAFVATLIPIADCRRHEGRCAELARLLCPDPAEGDVLRAVLSCVAGALPSEEVSAVASRTVDHLIRSGTVSPLLPEVVEYLEPGDARRSSCVRRLVTTLADQEAHGTVVDVTDRFLAQAPPAADDVGWARQALAYSSLTADWERARSLFRQDRSLTSLAAQDGRPRFEFALEAPDVFLGPAPGGDPAFRWAGVLAGAASDGTAPTFDDDPDNRLTQRIIRTLARAATGRPCEGDLGGLSAELRGRGLLSLSALDAALFAATSLLLSDHEAAQSWAQSAQMASRNTSEGAVGLAHLVAAHSLLRTRHTTEARAQAVRAQHAFAAVRSQDLQMVAEATTMHIDLQSAGGAPVVRDPCRTGVPAHPLFAAYVTYVRARRHIVAGELQDAVRELFAAGRILDAAGYHNPTLLPWRLHLIALFRATGQGHYAVAVERELGVAVREYAGRNPLAAQRWVEAADLDQRLLTDDSAQPETLPTARAPISASALSGAETRVVRLVMNGMSNAEVGRALFLSKRTVDTHLANVYRKLGIHSRRQLQELAVTSPLLLGGDARDLARS